MRQYFNPRSRMGSDSQAAVTAFIQTHFNPRSPHEERLPFCLFLSSDNYFNPRSPHEERLPQSPDCVSPTISIHAPRMESDRYHERCTPPRYISIHAPPHGERPFKRPIIIPCSTFQSTLPHGERLAISFAAAVLLRISIHAPRMGSDQPHRYTVRQDPHFNPRPPHGERQLRGSV